LTIQKYNAKRNFRRTPEPAGGKGPRRDAGPLRFVVQKHDATRLHYDFRLELGGALKSWAVPKGPSLRPEDKRLAVMVEDHPLDYRTFEGTIPAGNYGAGTVMVWDQGTYHAVGAETRADTERILAEGLRTGRLKFVLYGSKLQGEFTLVKSRRGTNDWLLIKHRDQFANDRDVTVEDRSAVTARNLEEIATGLTRRRRRASIDLSDAPQGKMPHDVAPMLASLVKESFQRHGWVFEVKWDGYRAIAEVASDGVRLYSRNQISLAERFGPIVRALERLGHEAVIDGEVVVVDPTGVGRFQLLQNYQKTGKGALLYYVFDLLYLDGHDLRSLPLLRRKELLARVVAELPTIRFSEHVERDGVALFRAAEAKGLEGIIAKQGDSPYLVGRRSRSWLKIKTHRRQEAVIGGFTEPRGSRDHLGALLLGVYENDRLVPIGHTGGGLDSSMRRDLRSRLEPLETKTCPFHPRPRPNAPVHWVEPLLVCEVSFGEWTHDGVMRHPIFVGLREDKLSRSVRRESPLPREPDEHIPTPAPADKGGHRKPQPTKPTPEFTNLDRIYFPKEGYTKRDLIDYYRTVAPVMLPYLVDRPQSLHRHPNGIDKESFFQKDFGDQVPEWFQTVRVPSSTDRGETHYVLCQDEASLLFLANLGCIEINPWNSRVGHLNEPDYMVIDLDPEEIPFDRVVEAALAVRRLLDRIGAESRCKTSGKTGLHVYVPLGAKYTVDEARQFAELVATVVQRELWETTSTLRRPALRRRRVYLDFLQNRTGQTLAAPYSVRPVAGAPVSTPLKWSEVRRGLDPAKFTMQSVPRRLDRVGDLWKPVLGRGIDLAACLDRLARAGSGSDRRIRNKPRKPKLV
jgi:bifunctional non-homologous end joining protein LigD